VYTVIADYCQNLELPHFGTEQPGATYYLTPTKLEGFGVADVSYTNEKGTPKDHLYFHCYNEGHGAKGGNNVASMLIKTLMKIGIMKVDSNGNPIQGKELNVVMDNCTGQNKNNMVLLLAPWLVELGYFQHVNMVFLVVGHIKNVCDRRFNNLKHRYHKSNVYNLADVVSVLSVSNFVSVWPVDTLFDWRDYESFLLQPYRKLAEAKLKIKSNHIFTAQLVVDVNTNIETLQFFTRQSHLPYHPPVYGNITNSKFAEGAGRLSAIKNLQAKMIRYPGLPGYKQVMMHKKYTPYVPPKYHNDILYKEPSQKIKDSKAKDQQERKAYKKMKKEERSIDI
jgi:hypothetical protein